MGVRNLGVRQLAAALECASLLARRQAAAIQGGSKLPHSVYNANLMEGAGGTRGGIGQFLIGLGMAIAGGYLLTNQVTVQSNYWHLWGYNGFGLSLIPLVIGIALLFFDGRSIIGWLLTFAAAIIIFVGIITNLDIYFRPTSLFATLLMLVLLAGGIGLVARSLRAQ